MDEEPPPTPPQWWAHRASTAWERTKDAFHRSWAQTRADLSIAGARDLHRRVDDEVVPGAAHHDPDPSEQTLKPGEFRVLAGSRGALRGEKIAGLTTMGDRLSVTWRQAEREARFGYTMRLERPDVEWGDALEQSLRAEWESLGTRRSWEDARGGVRSGWEYARSTR